MTDIDITKPVTGAPTTQSVRDNFAAAATEIDAAQASADAAGVAAAAAQSTANNALPLAGGTLSGPLVLDADPIAPLEAATKQYADASGGGTTGDSHLVIYGYDMAVVVGAPYFGNYSEPSQYHNMAFYTSPSANGDTVEFTVDNMEPGNYELEELLVNGNVSGITELWQDGVFIESRDDYNAVLTFNVFHFTPVILVAGPNVFQYIVNGKNAASGSYLHNITMVTLRKT